MPKRSFADYVQGSVGRSTNQSAKKLLTSLLKQIERQQRPSSRDYPTPRSIPEYSTETTSNPASVRAHSIVGRASSNNERDSVGLWCQTQDAQKSTTPLLRRSTSLPTLDNLRSLSPLTLLTHQNLQAMDPSAAVPVTPEKSTSGRSRTSISSSTTDMGRRMALIGLLDCDSGRVALEQRPLFHDMIKQILGGQRASSIKPGSSRAFRETLVKMRKRNEATVAERLMPFLVKKERTVSMQPIEDESEPDLVSGKEIDSATRRAFELDHLDWSIDKDFTRNCVPIPDAFAERSPSELGVKNPKPDITYGFEPTAFTEEEQLDLNTFEPELSAGIISPFFVIQWKGFAGSLEKAKEQARRDGAAMVHARRKAMRKISLIDQWEPNDKLDWDTMAFTCAITTYLSHIHVHWAEVTEGKVSWHIAKVGRYNIDEEEGVRDLRQALHNILDWGLGERMATVKSQLKIYQEKQSGLPLGVEPVTGKRRRVE